MDGMVPGVVITEYMIAKNNYAIPMDMLKQRFIEVDQFTIPKEAIKRKR